MNSRATILSSIRHSLAAKRVWLEQEAARAAEPRLGGPFVRTDLTPTMQFILELEALNGHVHLCRGAQEASARLLDLLRSHDAAEVLCWDGAALPLPGIEQLLQTAGIRLADGRIAGTEERAARLQALEAVPVCISGADAAVAESGTIVVVSGPGRGRLASLIAPVHIAILPEQWIVRSLPAAFDLLYDRFGPALEVEHANITLISGPSRTADIEQTLTLGVHGPKEVHVLIVSSD